MTHHFINIAYMQKTPKKDIELALKRKKEIDNANS